VLKGSKKNGDRKLVSQDFSGFLRIRMDLRDCKLNELPGIGIGAGSSSSGETFYLFRHF
jgi:hypothetical protein